MHSELPHKVVLLLRVMYSTAEKPRIVVMETFLLVPICSPVQLTWGLPFMYFYLFVFYLCVLINNYINYLLHKCKSDASHCNLHYFSEGSHYCTVSV